MIGATQDGWLLGWDRIPGRDSGTWAPDNEDAPKLAVTDNPVVATLLGPNGAPIRQWRERPPFGFQKPDRRTRR